MKKGLTTLLTVAIALVSVQAFGRAPVIQDIPSPIIGNQSGASQPTQFVYQDAFDLNKYVSDDSTPDASLKWSYEVVGAQRYSINGNGPLAGTDNPVLPPANKTIAGPGALLNSMTGATGGLGADATTSTITIRDILLYPYGGTPNATQNPNHKLGDFSQVVTFWCSDGELASTQDVLFYTDNQYTNNLPTGWNRLSGGIIPQEGDEIVHDSNPGGWKRDASLWLGVTTSTYKGKGLCLNVPLTGTNWGAYGSVQPYFTMTPNTVYRIRLTMNCTQATPGKTPFWDFLLENLPIAGQVGNGMNMYGMDAMIMDNEGGSNGVISSDLGSEVTLYWAPAAWQTPQWNSATAGVYTAGRASRRDPCMRFRVMDVDTVGVPNNLKAGGICLQSVVVEAIPASYVKVLQNVYNVTTPTETAATGDGGNIRAEGILGAICNFNNPTAPGTLTVSPNGPGSSVEIVTVRPSTNRVETPMTSNVILDEYPIDWESNTIYKFEVQLSAPDTNSENSPFDVIWMTMESLTNELITDSYVTANGDGTAISPAMPKMTTSAGQTGPQKYAMFFYSGKETWSTVSQFHRLRWRLRFGNAPAPINWPQAANTSNLGSARLHNVKVDIVDFVKP